MAEAVITWRIGAEAWNRQGQNSSHGWFVCGWRNRWQCEWFVPPLAVRLEIR